MEIPPKVKYFKTVYIPYALHYNPLLSINPTEKYEKNIQNFCTIFESKSQFCLIVYFAGSELEAYSDEDYSGEGRRGRHGGAWDRRNKR